MTTVRRCSPCPPRDGLDWAAGTGALLAAFPRYHPRWAWWMVRVPLLREFAVSNLVLVLRAGLIDSNCNRFSFCRLGR